MAYESYFNKAVLKNYPSLDDKLCRHPALPHFYHFQMSFKTRQKDKNLNAYG